MVLLAIKFVDCNVTYGNSEIIWFQQRENAYAHLDWIPTEFTTYKLNDNVRVKCFFNWLNLSFWFWNVK